MVSFPAIFPSYQLTDLSSNLIHLSTPFFFLKLSILNIITHYCKTLMGGFMA